MKIKRVLPYLAIFVAAFCAYGSESNYFTSYCGLENCILLLVPEYD